MSDRIAELESQIAFQDNTIQELNDIVTRQQKQLEDLSAAVKLLLNQVKQLNDVVGAPEGEEPPPPHY